MKQQLSIGISIIDYLCSNRPKTGYGQTKAQENARKIYDLIEDNFIVMDNQYAKEITDKIESISREKYGNAADELKTNLQLLLYNRGYKLAGDSSEYDLFRLAGMTQDKIAFDPVWDNRNIRKNEKTYPDIEFHTIQSFIEPEVYHRLKNVPFVYTIESGIVYDLNIILSPLLRYAKHVRIIDQYMMNERARNNLIKIIECINPESRIILCPLSRHKYLERAKRKIPAEKKIYQKNYEEFDKIVDKMKVERKIDIEEIRGAKHIDRYIITDEYEIQIPCLDFIDNNGEAKMYDPDTDIQKIRFNWLTKTTL